MSASKPFRVVQPYGRHIATESTVISEHATAVEAFANIDRQSAQMVRTGVAESDGNRRRPGVQSGAGGAGRRKKGDDSVGETAV
jgi:hypothetical protein